MLKFNHINFKYDNNAIFDDFTQSFPENKINCIIGPSGSGKTTMLNLIAQTLKPIQGSIQGLDKQVSYLFQEERLINEISVFKNLDFILKSAYPNKDRRHTLIIDGLKSVDLQNTENMFPNQLSGSMKRRLAMLRAFLYPSKILLMDEPFTGLDINIKQQILKLFIKLWNEEKRTVFFVSHNLDETLLLADRVYIMSKKPMRVIKTLDIQSLQSKRFVYDKNLIQIKKQIMAVVDKW